MRLKMGIVAAILALSAAAWAFVESVKTFQDAYKIDQKSALGKAKCAVCHPAANKTDKLNPYGTDLQKIMKAKKTKVLTKEILTKANSLDSDKDSFSNIAEIKAGKLPGDPKSKPKK